MRWAAAILAVLVSCSDERPGLSLEVFPGDPAVVTVELFVGGRCHDCPSMAAPPAMDRMAVDEVFLVGDTERWLGDARGVPSLGFRIPPRDEPHTIAIIHVVGYDDQRAAIASGTIYNYELRPGVAEHGRITLRPTQQLEASSSAQPAGTRRIAQWRTGTLPACTLAELWDAEGVHRDLLVPATDLDCDGHQDECAPWIPDAVNEPPTIERADCMTTISTNQPTCYVGGAPCTEGEAPDVLACVPLETRHCAPDRVCRDRVTFPYDAARLQADLTRAIYDNATIHLRCQIGAMASGWCNSEEIIEGVDASSIIGTAACEAVGLHPFVPPFDGPADHLTLDLGELAVERVAAPCVVDFKFTSASLVERPELAYLNIQLTNGQHLFIPTMVERVSGCELPARCKFARPANLYDNLDRCVSVPQPGGSCAPQGNCAGPLCGPLRQGRGVRPDQQWVRVPL